jgi:hypothetical protein
MASAGSAAYAVSASTTFNRRQLDRVLLAYARRYNHRPHRSLAFRPPDTDRTLTPLRAPPYPRLSRRDLLGGLIHE